MSDVERSADEVITDVDTPQGRIDEVIDQVEAAMHRLGEIVDAVSETSRGIQEVANDIDSIAAANDAQMERATRITARLEQRS